ECLIARTGYTGEDGFELFVDSGRAEALFDAIHSTGKAEPVGIGARDTLRLEAALPLYGHELDRQTTPLEAGLSHFVKFDHEFVGRSALQAERDRGLKKHLIGLASDDRRSVMRQGYAIDAGSQS